MSADLKLLKRNLKATMTKIDRFHGRMTRVEAIESLGEGWRPSVVATSKGAPGAAVVFEKWHSPEGETVILCTQAIAGREASCRVYREAARG